MDQHSELLDKGWGGSPVDIVRVAEQKRHWKMRGKLVPAMHWLLSNHLHKLPDWMLPTRLRIDNMSTMWIRSLPTTPQVLRTYVSIRLGQSGTIASASPTNLFRNWKLLSTLEVFMASPKELSTLMAFIVPFSPFQACHLQRGLQRYIPSSIFVTTISKTLSKTSQKEALPAWIHREDISMITKLMNEPIFHDCSERPEADSF